MSSTKKPIITILSLIIFCVLILLPNFVKEGLPKNYPFKKIRLGLDLRGGSYLILGVKTEEAVKSALASQAIGIKSELKDQRVGLLRTKVINDQGIEIQLLTNSSVDKVKSFMTENYPDLTFSQERAEGEQYLVSYVMPEKAREEIKSNSVTQAIETIRNRVDQFGVAEPTIQSAGKERLMVQLPEVTNFEQVKKTLGSVAKLEFRLLADASTPASRKLTLPSKEGGSVVVEDEVLMSGDAIEKASFETDQDRASFYQVNIKLNAAGKATFSRITTEYGGSGPSKPGRSLAIILDGKVQSSPTINDPITTGRAQITGNFTRDDARDLSIVLKSGALPAPLTFDEERTVGASLGADSIRQGITACLVGSLVVVAFMIFYYKKSGVLAVFSLLVNVLMLLAGLSLFGATLTLPGLAGLALTVGMAVDANVIIYERIREELKSGSSIPNAIKAGFERANLTIVDANLTTLLTGIILYFFGTGPIRGFAVTLNLGILTSMFAALYLSKVGFSIFQLRNRKGELSI